MMSALETTWRRSGWLTIVVALLLWAALARPALAQTSPRMLIGLTKTKQLTQVSYDAFIFNSGNSDNVGPNEFNLTIHELEGYISPLPEHDIARVGFDFTHYDIDSNDPMLPDQLTDQSLAIGTGLASFGRWKIAGVFGFGFAGDQPYSDSNAWYALAQIVVAYDLNERSKLVMALEFDGNRTFLPDLPVPAIAYIYTVNNTLQFVVGLPYGGVDWKPLDRLTIHVNYKAPLNLTLDVDYEFIDHWHAYLGVANRVDAFHIDGDLENRRLFFRQRRVEIGIRWKPCPRGELRVAGGYAFDQEFERGWDARDLDTVRNISDEPYLRAGFNLRF